VAVLAERCAWLEQFMTGVGTRVPQARDNHFKGHTPLACITLHHLEEHTHCHERVISSNAKLYYTLSDLRRRQGTSNSRNQRTRQRRTRKSGLSDLGLLLLPFEICTLSSGNS
jgi:hypothetical protein